jgi:hypothetical protein
MFPFVIQSKAYKNNIRAIPKKTDAIQPATYIIKIVSMFFSFSGPIFFETI